MLSFGFSPCPNDTFSFYALVNSKVDLQGLQFKPVIDDVQNLNIMGINKQLDITKVSCHAYAYMQGDYIFLSAGAAFGRGCGPVIVAKDIFIERADKRPILIAAPGEYTTATLLLKIFMRSIPDVQYSIIHMPFNRIAEAVKYAPIDAGVIIHEVRFTFHNLGLVQVIDLGQWWEKTTGLPIPLGGIAAKKSLGKNVIDIVTATIKDSIHYAYRNRNSVMPFIKKYSQELSDDVITQHIDLYVTPYSLDIADDGKKALQLMVNHANDISKDNQ